MKIRLKISKTHEALLVRFYAVVERNEFFLLVQSGIHKICQKGKMSHIWLGFFWRKPRRCEIHFLRLTANLKQNNVILAKRSEYRAAF